MSYLINWAIVLILLIVSVQAAYCKRMSLESPPLEKIELVMSVGMRITAVTPSGRIAITALDRLTRSYTWAGATRTVEMGPRSERWYGSLGAYYPGPGDHWDEHNGITRGVVEEGQQHFKSSAEALKWIRSRTWMPYVYRDNGLVVGWDKTLPRRQLNVEVWQILIGGKKPRKLPGSQNDKITVTRVKLPTIPLAAAVGKGNTASVRALLARSADPNSKDVTGSPVLVLAAKRGSGAIVQALLDKGAGVNVRDTEGSTPLIEAAGAGHTDIVLLLLKKGARVNDSHQKGLKKGMTPLLAAVMLSRVQTVRVLLDNGADVKVKLDAGLTALNVATNAEIIRLLKNAGATE